MKSYPENCGKDEAIECVKAGGKARLKGSKETNWTRVRRSKSGDVFVVFPVGRKEFSESFNPLWDYQITEPAPKKSPEKDPSLYSTAEAVAELLCSGDTMLGKREADGVEFTLMIDGTGDVRCTNQDGYRFSFIPGDATWEKKPQLKPKPIERDITIGPNSDTPSLSENIARIQKHWN